MSFKLRQMFLGGLHDIGYPNFPFMTLAPLRTVASVTKVGGGTLTDQTMADSPYGTTALQYNLSTTAGSIRGAILSTPINVNNGNIRWTWKPIQDWVTNNILALISASCSIRIYSSGSPASPPANFHSMFWGNIRFASTSPTTNTPGRWQQNSWPLSAFTVNGTGANLSAITWASIDFRTTSATDIIMGVGDIDFVPNPRSKGAMIFRFDDGHETAYTNAFPVLQSIGKPGLLFISPLLTALDSPGPPTTITTAQVIEMMSAGWQCGAQSFTTEDNAIVDAWSSLQRDNEYKGLRKYAQSKFGINGYYGTADGSYYSNVGISDRTAYPELARNFRTLWRFQAGQGTGTPLPDGETFPFSDPHNVIALNAQTWSDGTTVTKIGTAIDQTVANKGVLMLAYHDIPNTGEGWDGFNAAIARASDLDIVTPISLLSPYLVQCGSAKNLL